MMLVMAPDRWREEVRAAAVDEAGGQRGNYDAVPVHVDDSPDRREALFGCAVIGCNYLSNAW